MHFRSTIMLYVKKSKIPKAGKGLFTSKEIKKGEVVCEYEGERITWKECQRRNEAMKGKGAYFFHISDKNCIDAQHTPWALGRYANDAAGLTRISGLRNNSHYKVSKGRAYIVASRTLKPETEVLVAYGKDYWDAMKED